MSQIIHLTPPHPKLFNPQRGLTAKTIFFTPTRWLVLTSGERGVNPQPLENQKPNIIHDLKSKVYLYSPSKEKQMQSCLRLRSHNQMSKKVLIYNSDTTNSYNYSLKSVYYYHACFQTLLTSLTCTASNKALACNDYKLKKITDAQLHII